MLLSYLAKLRNKYGITVLELLISSTISITVIAAVYQLFHTQNRSYLKQDQIIETQQNLRAMISVLSRDLQIIGYDPKGKADAGIVSSFPSPHNIFSIDYGTNSGMVAFTFDLNNDGYTAPEDDEYVAYRLHNKSIEKYSSSTQQWLLLSNNIEALDFVYLDGDGNRTYDRSEFKAVEVSVLARTNRKGQQNTTSKIYKNKQGENICPSCGIDPYHRRLVSFTLQFRNLNL